MLFYVRTELLDLLYALITSRSFSLIFYTRFLKFALSSFSFVFCPPRRGNTSVLIKS